VEIANGGVDRVPVTGLELTDYTATQQQPHVFRFPKTTENGTLYLGAGKSAYVFTGPGTNARNDDDNLILFWNRSASVWNNDGDVAYLRHTNGQLVDSMTVGDPKRHPNGH
jgi:Lamin Tail Domain